MRIGDGWDVDIYKAMILAVEEDAMAMMPVWGYREKRDSKVRYACPCRIPLGVTGRKLAVSLKKLVSATGNVQERARAVLYLRRVAEDLRAGNI